MGVINMTPDSFSDGGKYNKINSALEHAKYFIKKGCKIIDVGGRVYKTRCKRNKFKNEWKRIKGFFKKTKKLKLFNFS